MFSSFYRGKEGILRFPARLTDIAHMDVFSFVLFMVAFVLSLADIISLPFRVVSGSVAVLWVHIPSPPLLTLHRALFLRTWSEYLTCPCVMSYADPLYLD